MHISLIIALLLSLTIIIGFAVNSFSSKKEEPFIINPDNIIKDPSSGVTLIQ